MNVWKSKTQNIIDSHVHMSGIGSEESMLKILEATGIDKLTLVAMQNPAAGEGLPQALYMKARHPGRFFVLAGLNHAEKLSDGKVAAPSLAEQVDAFGRIGCDGIKMIEGKPTRYRQFGIPLTHGFYTPWYERLEETGF